MGITLKRFGLLAAFILIPAMAPAWGDETQKAPAGDDHPDFFAMHAKQGLLLVSNEDDSHFFVRIRGNKVQQGTLGEGEDAFGVVVVDDLIVQFVTAGVTQFYNGDFSKLTDEEILKKHMEWELAYLREKFNRPFKTGMNLAIKGANQRIYYYWTYDIPNPAEKGIKRNVMLTTRVKNEIVVLNGILLDLDDKEEEALMQKLVEIMNTLTVFPDPITVNRAKSYAVQD
jgi:hypothetical protein